MNMCMHSSGVGGGRSVLSSWLAYNPEHCINFILYSGLLESLHDV